MKEQQWQRFACTSGSEDYLAFKDIHRTDDVHYCLGRTTVKNLHQNRTQRRTQGRTPVWYDSGLCNISFDEAMLKLAKSADNSRYSVSVRCRSRALFVAGDEFKKFYVPVAICYDVYKKTLQKQLLISYIPNHYAQFVATVIDNFDELFNSFHFLPKNEVAKYFGDAAQQLSIPEDLVQYLFSNIFPKIPKCQYKCAEARDLFTNNFPLLTIYSGKNFEAFFVKKIEGIDWTSIAELNWPNVGQTISQESCNSLNEIVVPAMEMCSSERDRGILKCILSKLFSTEQLLKLKVVSRGSALRTAVVGVESSVHKIENDFHAKRSGRRSKQEIFEDLTSVLLQVFDGSGEGLRAHPRLITDILFLEHKWVDMPRAVSVLQACGIDISLSCAYTYTSNFRKRSIEASRHPHALPLSIKRSTRDVVKNPSINSHYATCDVQYSYNAAFTNRGNETAVVARDDKAKVHLDSEVVDRPSKSWQRVRYSDHHFSKDSRRTVTITTYQFVSRKEMHDQVLISAIDDIPVTRTRVTGPGLCLVKATHFEAETIFRHMNELLAVMCENPEHFKNEDGMLKANLLLTVDGGGDERPRNKMTKFCVTLLRWLLQRDRIKVQSYAEHDSKLHSVERIHSQENRALSQGGEISSYSVHSNENDEIGQHSLDKMKENIEYAVLDVANRLDGTPFAEHSIRAMRAPTVEDWVFNTDYEQNIRDFLRSDSTSHRLNFNFDLKPDGPIWFKLKSLFSLADPTPAKISAFDIFNVMNDPKYTHSQHYGFTVYRQDEMWQGSNKLRFEIQPILDASKLPEYHYLSYDQSKLMVLQSNSTQLTSPDFFLPSINIENLLNDSTNEITSENLAALSDVVGVPISNIDQYLQERDRKLKEAKANKQTVDSFNNSPLVAFKRDELLQILKQYGCKMTNRYYKKGELLTLVNSIITDKQIDSSVLINKYKRN